MFGMYECDNSSFKHFFKVIFCQMYHILVIEITSKRILCKSMENTINVTNTGHVDLLIGWSNKAAARAQHRSNWSRQPLGGV